MLAVIALYFCQFNFTISRLNKYRYLPPLAPRLAGEVGGVVDIGAANEEDGGGMFLFLRVPLYLRLTSDPVW